jgi:hypothetical protein
MRRALNITAALVAAFFLTGTAAAQAAGPPIESWTVHVVDEVDVTTDVHPCTGQAAELTAVESGVIHFVAQGDGTVHIAGTLRGTYSADALPTDGTPDATGTFVATFGGNGLLLEGGEAVGKAVVHSSVSGTILNADGSTEGLHRNGVTVYDGDGLPRLDIFHEVLRCS